MEIDVGDVVIADGEEYTVKYPMKNGSFIDEVGEMVFPQSIIIKNKNLEKKDLSEFNGVQQRILKFFIVPRNMNEMNEESIGAEKVDIKFEFERLTKEKYIMRLFNKKNTYISKIDNNNKVSKLI